MILCEFLSNKNNVNYRIDDCFFINDDLKHDIHLKRDRGFMAFPEIIIKIKKYL